MHNLCVKVKYSIFTTNNRIHYRFSFHPTSRDFTLVHFKLVLHFFCLLDIAVRAGNKIYTQYLQTIHAIPKTLIFVSDCSELLFHVNYSILFMIFYCCYDIVLFVKFKFNRRIFIKNLMQEVSSNIQQIVCHDA